MQSSARVTMYSPSAFVFVLISCGIITVTAQTPTPAPADSKFVLLVCVSAALCFGVPETGQEAVT